MSSVRGDRIDLALGMRLVWSRREEARIDRIHDMLLDSRATLREILVAPTTPATAAPDMPSRRQ